MIDDEMKRFDLSQETFAFVAMGKTQATLSEMLKRREKGLPETKASLATLRHCLKFLRDKPEKERKTKYVQFNVGDRAQLRLKREYAGIVDVDDDDGVKLRKGVESEKRSQRPFSTGRKESLGPVAVGVLKEYHAKFKRKPDAAGLNALAEVLNLSQKTISDWFRTNAKSDI